MHFNWTQLIPGVGHHYTHVATLAIVSFVLILIGIYARVSLGAGETAVIPTSKFQFAEYLNFSLSTLVD